nr:ribonuclease P protein subunit p14 isoform X3 [Peromyscus maniculatus bairdii]
MWIRGIELWGSSLGLQDLCQLPLPTEPSHQLEKEHFTDSKIGAALPVDVLTYEEKTLSAILRVCSSGLAKLWSSLTLFGAYKNKKCAFRVIQVSPFLLALSGNSREQVLD